MFDTSEKATQSGTLTAVNQKWADLLTDVGRLPGAHGAAVSCLPPLPPGNLKLHTSPAALMCHGARDKSSLWKQTKKLLWKLLTSIVSLTSCYHCTWSCSGLTKDTSKDIRPLSKSILSSKKEFLVSWIKDHTHHPPYILPFLCFCSPFPTVESSQWSSAGVWQSAPI